MSEQHDPAGAPASDPAAAGDATPEIMPSLEELLRKKWIQFDGDVVDAFLQVVANHPNIFETISTNSNL